MLPRVRNSRGPPSNGPAAFIHPCLERGPVARPAPIPFHFWLSPLVGDAAFRVPAGKVVIELGTAVHVRRPASAECNKVKPGFDFAERLIMQEVVGHRERNARIEQIDGVVVAGKLIPHPAEDPGFARMTGPPIELGSEPRADRTAEAVAVAEVESRSQKVDVVDVASHVGQGSDRLKESRPEVEPVTEIADGAPIRHVDVAEIAAVRHYPWHINR